MLAVAGRTPITGALWPRELGPDGSPASRRTCQGSDRFSLLISVEQSRGGIYQTLGPRLPLLHPRETFTLDCARHGFTTILDTLLQPWVPIDSCRRMKVNLFTSFAK